MFPLVQVVRPVKLLARTKTIFRLVCCGGASMKYQAARGNRRVWLGAIRSLLTIFLCHATIAFTPNVREFARWMLIPCARMGLLSWIHRSALDADIVHGLVLMARRNTIELPVI